MTRVTQCDQHRRDADAIHIDNLIASGKQKKRNAVEWLKRARKALDDGDLPLMLALCNKAVLETQGVGGVKPLPFDTARQLSN